MAEIFSETLLTSLEWSSLGSSWTNNNFFDEKGYLIVKNICDPNLLKTPIPEERGQLHYVRNGRKLSEVEKIEGEQVEGAIARMGYPKYKKIHSQLRKSIEFLIGKKLYNTYYYDRFYFPGQELHKHLDRPACEISISIHIESNINCKWPLWIKTPDEYYDEDKSKLKSIGKNISIDLEPGDGLIYKGCERPHWRERMPGTLESVLSKKFGHNLPQLYYHQIFFHYVLQDGFRAHYAWDSINDINS